MRVNLLIILILNLIIGSTYYPQAFAQTSWSKLSSDFEKGYNSLAIPPLRLSYTQNLKSIKNKSEINKQRTFFTKIQRTLASTDLTKLTLSEKIDFEIIQYEISINLERINLESQWDESIDISSKGLSNVPNSKAWYIYFLKRWVDQEVSPDEIFQFGLKEINRVKSRMNLVQKKSGLDSSSYLKYINDPSFYFHDLASIQHAFEQKREEVAENLTTYFPFAEKVSIVQIAEGNNEALSQVPAYYTATNQTFYYNFFNQPFNKRQIAWIYLHEAIPGHHYQSMINTSLPKSSIQKMFHYFGYSEGYAAYTEEIGYEIGAYKNIYDELGKWEWDIIRSVRVSMDVGLNYYDWSDEKALDFWKQHISEKDEIGRREIARMKRWPAQVITYKYGADKILQWKSKLSKLSDYSLKTFHQKILEHGPITSFRFRKSRIKIDLKC